MTNHCASTLDTRWPLMTIMADADRRSRKQSTPRRSRSRTPARSPSSPTLRARSRTHSPTRSPKQPVINRSTAKTRKKLYPEATEQNGTRARTDMSIESARLSSPARGSALVSTHTHRKAISIDHRKTLRNNGQMDAPEDGSEKELPSSFSLLRLM